MRLFGLHEAYTVKSELKWAFFWSLRELDMKHLPILWRNCYPSQIRTFLPIDTNSCQSVLTIFWHSYSFVKSQNYLHQRLFYSSIISPFWVFSSNLSLINTISRNFQHLYKASTKQRARWLLKQTWQLGCNDTRFFRQFQIWYCSNFQRSKTM